MDGSKLGLAAEVAIETVKSGDVTEEQAMRFLISQYEELKVKEEPK